MMYLCVGGPWDGEWLELSSPSTMVIRVGRAVGRYCAPPHLKIYVANKRLHWEGV